MQLSFWKRLVNTDLLKIFSDNNGQGSKFRVATTSSSSQFIKKNKLKRNWNHEDFLLYFVSNFEEMVGWTVYFRKLNLTYLTQLYSSSFWHYTIILSILNSTGNIPTKFSLTILPKFVEIGPGMIEDLYWVIWSLFYSFSLTNRNF